MKNGWARNKTYLDFVQSECQLHYDPKYLKGMVGQTAARRAAGVVVEMVKEGMKELNSQ